MRVLTVNAGSSSLKIRLLDHDDTVLQSADLDAPGGVAQGHDVRRVLQACPRPDVVAHRVVHGGTEFTGPVVLDAAVVAKLEQLTTLAPLHQPKSLSALRAVADVMPDVPAVACFDTAFHATIPPAAFTYAVPRAWHERYGVRKYGFHGLSHAYSTRRVGELMSVTPPRLVVAHLGAGCSLTAVVGGRSRDTTMGFTPLAGLVMATRSGDVDPGLLLWLEQHEGLAPADVAQALEHEAGLKALAGDADFRHVLAAERYGDERAVLAMEVYVHRLVTLAAAMAAAAGGLDALVFTGGVGERSADVRRRCSEGLAHLGVSLDAGANEAADSSAQDVEITGTSAAARVFVVRAREDLQMARECRRLLGADTPTTCQEPAQE
jgi:acetate kinase